MDEINEQTENMKQIPEAFSAPTHFDEVIVLLMPFHFSQVLFSCQKKKHFLLFLNYQLIESCDSLLEILQMFLSLQDELEAARRCCK
jgi:hypothetical protein